jgi:hypothetical protein
VIIALVLIATLFALAAFYGVEDRGHMKRIDVSPARPDAGLWLSRR